MWLSILIADLSTEEQDFVVKLYMEYGDFMFYEALKILKNEHDAQDAVQDAFVDLSLFLEPELYENTGSEPHWYENGEGRTILGGIVLKEGSALHQAGYYHANVVIGVAANAENLDAAVTFVRQVLACGVD